MEVTPLPGAANRLNPGPGGDLGSVDACCLVPAADEWGCTQTSNRRTHR